MADNRNEPECDEQDFVPPTDEEYAEYLKKEKRTAGIIKEIVDFITGYFS